MGKTYSLPTHAEMVENIRSVYYSATAEQLLDGSNWYNDAANLARSLSDSSGYSLEMVAGVIAALSPNTGWGQNVRLAIRMIESHGALNSGGLPDNLSKARKVVAGADIAQTLFGKNANKVVNFWKGILADGKTDAVCIDRHAFCIAIGKRMGKGESIPTLTPGRYAALTEAYRDAAIGTPYHAAQLQAITWVTWRNRYWAKGAFDGK